MFGEKFGRELLLLLERGWGEHPVGMARQCIACGVWELTTTEPWDLPVKALGKETGTPGQVLAV